MISIHAPREGGDDDPPVMRLLGDISIHAPREGGDMYTRSFCRLRAAFQSTPPARGATTPTPRAFATDCDFNPRPPRGGRPKKSKKLRKKPKISIHAPREGGDACFFCLSCPLEHFNPRPPRGGRHFCVSLQKMKTQFQSTPPARGATTKQFTHRRNNRFQSTPPARGATKRPMTIYGQELISIHAPREGGDRLLFFPDL